MTPICAKRCATRSNSRVNRSSPRPAGEEALRLLEAQSVALVVSDVRMMPMDGIALLKEIRTRYPHLPVVLMTAFADVDRAVEAMRAGACDFLLKPFEPKALLEHVARYRFAGGDGRRPGDRQRSSQPQSVFPWRRAWRRPIRPSC